MSSAVVPIAPGQRALEHLDKALAERPEKNGHELSATLRCLGEFRDGFIALRRENPNDPAVAALEPINAVISSVLAAQYPLGEIQWEEVVKARAWLASVVDSNGLG